MFGSLLSLPKFPNHLSVNALKFRPKMSSHIIHIADALHLQDDRVKTYHDHFNIHLLDRHFFNVQI